MQKSDFFFYHAAISFSFPFFSFKELEKHIELAHFAIFAVKLCWNYQCIKLVKSTNDIA